MNFLLSKFTELNELPTYHHFEIFSLDREIESQALSQNPIMTDEQQKPENGAQAADSASPKATPRPRRTTRTPRIGRARRQKKAADSSELPLSDKTPTTSEAPPLETPAVAEAPESAAPAAPEPMITPSSIVGWRLPPSPEVGLVPPSVTCW